LLRYVWSYVPSGLFMLSVISSSGERLRVVTPVARTTSGSCGMARATRLSTRTWDMFRSVPGRNVTVRV
jgi:hypothetical protein